MKASLAGRAVGSIAQEDEEPWLRGCIIIADAEKRLEQQQQFKIGAGKHRRPHGPAMSLANCATYSHQA
jgi:hypothetical protein